MPWLGGILALFVATGAAAPTPAPVLVSPATDPQRLLSILEPELNRNFEGLKAKAEPAPYFLSYLVTQEWSGAMTSVRGALNESGPTERRQVDVVVRVGSPEFDNYHALDGVRPRVNASTPIPIEDRPEAIRLLLWRETDRAWRAAADRLIQLKTSSRAPSEDKVPDFSQEEAVQGVQPPPPLKVSRDEWANRIRRLSNELAKPLSILNSSVTLVWKQEARSLVSSEGTRVHHGRNSVQIAMLARAKASDGEDLMVFRTFSASDFAGLPKEASLMEAVRDLQDKLRQLLLAKTTDPYAGPAILSGEAAAVFFHEIFGHRIEGHRQSDRTEGQTWSNSLNTQVLPDFLSVIADPTAERYAGAELNGAYRYDDEGIPARRVPIVEQGVLKTFLMSRTPVKGVAGSNGHGRKQAGLAVVSRQSNLIVESSRAVPENRLRQMLLEEVKRQGKPYGLYFDMVTGGYTTTRRDDLQAFTVVPLIVYKVFADGRPDELVRGVDIVGTPLASFGKILATGDKPGVFNGNCGAESGSVPVAAVSPALLVSEIEIQRKPVPSDRPPLLPPPDSTGGAE